MLPDFGKFFGCLIIGGLVSLVCNLALVVVVAVLIKRIFAL